VFAIVNKTTFGTKTERDVSVKVVLIMLMLSNKRTMHQFSLSMSQRNNASSAQRCSTYATVACRVPSINSAQENSKTVSQAQSFISSVKHAGTAIIMTQV